ncbi:efflux RND transporter permease subunit, partial [Pseudomonas aeruginosa]|uniref:efflux RND transporter permease subunit n=1 Tax=Pseudomonas aeruginosa TaxID=287 RepID=UPI0031B736AA
VLAEHLQGTQPRPEHPSEFYSRRSLHRRRGIKLATGANALDTAKAIKAKLAELQPFFPQGMKVLYPYDTTPFVQLSIQEVVKTLFEAIMLVFLVMYLFLQNMRATLIPTIAVPV